MKQPGVRKKEHFIKEIENCLTELKKQLETYEIEYPIGGSESHRAGKIKNIEDKIRKLKNRFEEVKEAPSHTTQAWWTTTLRDFKAEANEIKKEIENLPK